MSLKFLSGQGIDGSVGIGTNVPETKLDVRGDIQIHSGASANSVQELRFKNIYNTALLRASYTNPASTTETYLAFHTNTSGSSNGTVAEQMRIAGSNVGIGTNNPDNKLDVVVSDVNITPNAESSAVFRRNGNNYLTILSNASNEGGILFGNAVDDNDGAISYKHNTQSMQFSTADTERMRITSGGDVQISQGGSFSIGSGTSEAKTQTQVTSAVGTSATTILTTISDGMSSAAVSKVTFGKPSEREGRICKSIVFNNTPKTLWFTIP